MIVIYSFEHLYGTAEDDDPPAPRIPVRLMNGGETVSLVAIVDSGATVSLFHPEVACVLGIDLDSLEVYVCEAPGNQEVRVSVAEVFMEIAGQRIVATIGFSDAWRDETEGLLGRLDVCEAFHIGINHAERRLLLARVM